MRLLPFAIVLVSLGTARAESRIKDVDALVDAQVAAAYKGDEKAFRATLAKDGQFSFGGHPRWNVVARPLDGVADLKIARRRTGWSGTWGWSVVEITYTVPDPITHVRKPGVDHLVTFAVVERGAVKARFFAAGLASSDDGLRYMKWVDEMPAVAAPTELVARLAHPAAQTLSASPDVALVGTTPAELALGQDAAKQLLDVWRKMSFEVLDTSVNNDKADYVPVEITVGDAVLAWAPVRWKLASGTHWGKGLGLLIGKRTKAGVEVVVLAYE